MKNQQHVELIRLDAERRKTLIILGNLRLACGLLFVSSAKQAGDWRNTPAICRSLIKAIDYYQRAGMGRKAEAIGRLLDRYRRAWILHEEQEGFR